jgi:hypothetical protein
MMAGALRLLMLAAAATTTTDALPEYPKPPTPTPSTAVAVAGGPTAALGLNAKDFGAVGDGQTDDTRALQKAIDASQMAGRALLIPAGVYLVSSTLNISCRSPPLCDPGLLIQGVLGVPQDPLAPHRGPLGSSPDRERVVETRPR